MNAPFELRQADVRRRFDRAAQGFDDADFAHTHVRDGLFARLEPIDIDPTRVVDLGCATGSSAFVLEKRYRRARITAIDLSAQMLAALDAKRGWFSRVRGVQADASQLPLPDHSTGLVVSNLLLPWLDNPDPVFAEVNRVLAENGVFAFSTLGPDSLSNVAEAMRGLGEAPRINAFADMHDIGDGLVRAGLRDPVLDVDRLSISYGTPDALFRDLTATGARNALANRRRSLVGRRRFEDAAAKLGEAFTVELEIVYGHAWGSGQRPGSFRVDAGRIPVRRR